jgi:hypothetical protein
MPRKTTFKGMVATGFTVLNFSSGLILWQSVMQCAGLHLKSNC